MKEVIGKLKRKRKIDLRQMKQKGFRDGERHSRLAVHGCLFPPSLLLTVLQVSVIGETKCKRILLMHNNRLLTNCTRGGGRKRSEREK